MASIIFATCLGQSFGPTNCARLPSLQMRTCICVFLYLVFLFVFVYFYFMYFFFCLGRVLTNQPTRAAEIAVQVWPVCSCVFVYLYLCICFCICVFVYLCICRIFASCLGECVVPTRMAEIAAQVWPV